MTSRIHSLSISAVFALLFFVGTVSPVHAQLGVAAGLNFESADDIQAEEMDREATLDNSTGYHVGLVYQLGGAGVSLRPGLIYRRVGVYEFSDDAGYEVTAWEVPVDLKLTVLPAPLVSPYVLGGAMATFPQGEEEFDDAMEEVTYSFNVGAGVEISIPGSPLILQPEFRYEIGASSFMSEESVNIGGREFTPQESPQFSAIGLRLHLLF